MLNKQREMIRDTMLRFVDSIEDDCEQINQNSAVMRQIAVCGDSTVDKRFRSCIEDRIGEEQKIIEKVLGEIPEIKRKLENSLKKTQIDRDEIKQIQNGNLGLNLSPSKDKESREKLMLEFFQEQQNMMISILETAYQNQELMTTSPTEQMESQENIQRDGSGLLMNF